MKGDTHAAIGPAIEWKYRMGDLQPFAPVELFETHTGADDERLLVGRADPLRQMPGRQFFARVVGDSNERRVVSDRCESDSSDRTRIRPRK